MKGTFWVLVVLCIGVVGTAGVWHEGWKSREKGQGSLLAEEMPTILNNGDIIDLDDAAFDDGLANTDALKNPDPGKYGEDTREARPDDTGPEDDIGIHVSLNEGELITPIPYIFDTEVELKNVTSHANVSDDEDLSSGSGSGDIIIEIEDATNMFNSTLDSASENSTDDSSDSWLDSKPAEISMDYIFPLSETEDTPEEAATEETSENLPPYCEELFNVTWAPWSPWILSGDVSVRFRRCPAGHGYENSNTNCHGDYFEVRPCPRSDKRVCRSSPKEVTEEYHVTCTGIDINDVIHADELKSDRDITDRCEYSLYDVTYGMVIGEPVNSDGLQGTNPDLWCRSEEKYIPFHTPTQQCRNILLSFCKSHEMCKYDRDNAIELPRLSGELQKTCWKEFVIGGVLPTGFPGQGGHYMICQRFDKESKLGKAMGYKHSHFSTLYDTNNRIPVVSMVTVRALGDTKWPHVPYMVERGLIEDDGAKIISKFFKNKKRGITRIEDLTSECNTGKDACKLGEKQALPADYELSGYRIAHLISPDIVGNEMNKRISVFTMTNTVPIEPTVYPRWQYVQKVVRDFATKECYIPIAASDYVKKRHRNGNDLPEVYILSGAAFSSNHIEVIGNDVTVPKLVWIAACCAHGAEVSSFGIYMYNSFEQKPYVVSVENLQMLLQSTYYDSVDVAKIDLFPAFDGVCRSPEHDFSYKINIPF